jgi:hypothetical protein
MANDAPKIKYGLEIRRAPNNAQPTEGGNKIAILSVARSMSKDRLAVESDANADRAVKAGRAQQISAATGDSSR